MVQRVALAFLTVASPALLLTLLLPSALGLSPAGDVVFALVAVAFPIALIAAAADHRGRLGPLGPPLLALWLCLELCVAVMLAWRGQVLEAPWLGGLPLTAAVQLYGVFLLPLPGVALLYALTFDRFGLRQEDLEALRRRFPREGAR